MEVFPEAMVEGYEPLESVLQNAPGDRHVLAAAIHGKAESIVTFNLKHFRKEHLDPWNLLAVHPGEYLLTLYSISPAVVTSKLSAIGMTRNENLADVLSKLNRQVPAFAQQVAIDLGLNL